MVLLKNHISIYKHIRENHDFPKSKEHYFFLFNYSVLFYLSLPIHFTYFIRAVCVYTCMWGSGMERSRSMCIDISGATFLNK